MNKLNLYGKRKYSQVNPSSTSFHYLQIQQSNSLILKPFKPNPQNPQNINKSQKQISKQPSTQQYCFYEQITNFVLKPRKQNIHQFHTIEEIQSIQKLNNELQYQNNNTFDTKQELSALL